MKKYLILFFSILLTTLFYSENIIKFDNEDYKLSRIIDIKEGTENKFYKDNESVDAWQTLFSIIVYKGISELKQVLPNYINKMKPLMSSKPEFLQRKDVPDEIVIIMYLLSPEKTYYEYNICRFVKESGKIKLYRFAQKLPFKKELDVTDLIKKQNGKLEEIVLFKIDVVLEKK